MLDPLRTDWSAIAPLVGFGPMERTAAGFRATTEAGPIEVSAFAPDIFRLTLGELSGPDFGILIELRLEHLRAHRETWRVPG